MLLARPAGSSAAGGRAGRSRFASAWTVPSPPTRTTRRSPAPRTAAASSSSSRRHERVHARPGVTERTRRPGNDLVGAGGAAGPPVDHELHLAPDEGERCTPGPPRRLEGALEVSGGIGGGVERHGAPTVSPGGRAAYGAAHTSADHRPHRGRRGGSPARYGSPYGNGSIGRASTPTKPRMAGASQEPDFTVRALPRRAHRAGQRQRQADRRTVMLSPAKGWCGVGGCGRVDWCTSNSA